MWANRVRRRCGNAARSIGRSRSSLIVLLLAALPWPAAARSACDHVPGEILIRLDPIAAMDGPQIEPLRRDFARAGLRPERQLAPRLGIWLFSFDSDAVEAEELLASLRIQPSVEAAQLNHPITPRGLYPDDPLFPEQWALDNQGGHGGVPDADIDAPEAWERSTAGVTALGDTVIVAIVDDGSALDHADLRFWKNWREVPGNQLDDDLNGYVDDYDGWNALTHNGMIPDAEHGAHVTGIAAAIGDNATGISGVGWNFAVMPVVAMETEAAALEAYGYVHYMRWLYNETGGAAGAFVVVTNTSFGIDQGDPAEFPLWCFMYDALGSEGILSAAATANHNWNIDVVGDMPTGCPSDYLIAVTSTTIGDLIHYRAGWGPTTIDLGAPGDGILATFPGDEYGLLTGTSQASPHVAGAVAHLIAAGDPAQLTYYRFEPALTALELKETILATVDTLSTLLGRTVSGGRLNLARATARWQGSSGLADEQGPRITLAAGRPNPFRGSTRILLNASDTGSARVEIVDAAGRSVRSLARPAGAARDAVLWDGRDARGRSAPAGVYLCRVPGSCGTSEVRVVKLR
jgi:subtilisin family serine protease